MKDILNNNFNKELIVYAITSPDVGYVTLNCSTIRKCLKEGKKVLLYSLEQSESQMLKRLKLDDNSNLLIKEKPITNLEDISDTIDSFKADIVIIDYFWLLTRKPEVNNIFVLNRIARQYNIPFIVVMPLSFVKSKEVDFSSITLEEFKKKYLTLYPIIQTSERFILFYQKSPEEYLIRELINDFIGDTKEVNIKELLKEI